MRNLLSSLVVLTVFMVSTVAPAQESGAEQIELSPEIKVRSLAQGVWLYQASATLPGFDDPVSGNGLILVSGPSAMLIDLPWNDEQTMIIAEWIDASHQAKIEFVVPTHHHQDCAGGLSAAHEAGAESWALHKTTVKLYDAGGVIPKKSFTNEKILDCGDLRVELFYPGPGHTDDNIVAWLPDRKVLFGGCLLRSADAVNLGNIEEADLEAYPKTLEKLEGRYEDAEIVVPGHGEPGGKELIKHTIDLSKKQKR